MHVLIVSSHHHCLISSPLPLLNITASSHHRCLFSTSLPLLSITASSQHHCLISSSLPPTGTGSTCTSSRRRRRAPPPTRRRPGRGSRQPRGGSAITCTARTAHSEAPIVRGTGYGVDHLDQPGAGRPLRANIRCTGSKAHTSRYGHSCYLARSDE